MENYIPKIRFKGAYDENRRWIEFTHPWEQRKLSNTLISLQNNTLSRADLSNGTGVAKNVHYGDVLIKFGEILDVSKVQLPMISDESVLTKYKASFLQNGDVIVADTAEDTTVGKCSEVAGLNNEIVVSGLHTIPYRPVGKFASGYLGYYLNSSAYHNQLIPLMQGIKVTSISKSAMQDTDILYPKSVEEQSKIGAYFRSLDHLITFHQRKCELYQQAKQSMMEKLFSNNSDWEEVKFIDLFQEYSELNVNSYNQYTAGKYGLKLISDNKIKYDISKHKYFHPNSLILGIGIEEMGVSSNIFGCVSPIYMVYSINQDIIDTEFVNQYLRVELNKYKGTITHRSTRRKYEFDNKELHNLKIKIPCLEEQIKIANVLSKYDELIAISKNQLNILQTLKKGLLQQMFC